ncbi:imidazole glycerol phosphate synthase subunit HisH [Prochlorococcus marinus]|uniref:imidazole glycerol phosphate synthase subunit HisH n=1 Tax=Prochlorococcus marinus TaxID=1219 RepID=UPI0039AF279B
MIGVIDYGAGNIASVNYALRRIGESSEVVTNPENIPDFSHLVLPGVGSFNSAMRNLDDGNWINYIKDFVTKNKPLLGICLGMQLLFEEGEEHGKSNGLGLIPGKVKLMKTDKEKIPHVGWNRLYTVNPHPVMKGVKEHVDFYFVHSYHCIPSSDKYVINYIKYDKRFVSSVFSGSVIGMQFHPEKSQPAGLKILRNFCKWDGIC